MDAASGLKQRAASAVEMRSRDRQAAGRRKAILLLSPLLLFLAVFAALVASTIPRFGGPSGAAYGSDFAMFYEAAKVLDAGKNPYDANLLWHTERADFAKTGVKIPPDKALIEVGNPPVMFWALRPLTLLPFRTAGTIWTVTEYLFSFLGFLMLLRWLGWRKRIVPTAVLLGGKLRRMPVRC